jgi:hypothetical protein
MARYTSINMSLTFGGTTVSTNGRAVDLECKAAEPDIHDNSVAGQTTRTEQLGLGGAVRSKLSLSGLDESKGAGPILDLTAGSTGTLIFYPEGNTSTYEKVTMTGAIFLGVTRGFKIDDLATFSADWMAMGAPSYGLVT